MKKNNLIFILNGPSASGKSTIFNALIADKEMNLEKSVTATTRQPRSTPVQEINGKHYYFMTVDEFFEKRNAALEGKKGDVIVEHTEYPKNSGVYYGNYDFELQRIKDSDKDALIVVDKYGVDALKKFYGEENVISIFVHRDIVSIENALKERNLPQEEIDARLNTAIDELQNNASIADYVIYNVCDQESMIEEAKRIIEIEREKIKSKIRTGA